MAVPSITSPRLVISGDSAGCGKSLFTIGLTHELRRRKVSVSCCVLGPNLVESSILRRLSGRHVRSLDDRLLSAGQNLSALAQSSVGADIVLIEGRGGLYDGYAPGTLAGSDSEIAALTGSPIVLNVDVRGIGNSIAALIKGYVGFASGITFAGIIANRVHLPRVENDDNLAIRDREYYEATLQAFGLPKLTGAIPELPFYCAVPQKLVSQEQNLISLPRQLFVDLGQVVNRCVDVDALLQRAARVSPVEAPAQDAAPNARSVRIAVSDDSCFNQYFQDNFALLQHYGAEIVPFSPLADSALPKRIGGVYITGGSIKECASELGANTSIKNSILEFVNSGGVLYSEGAGSAYLCDRMKFPDLGDSIPGVGVIPGEVTYSSGEVSECDAVTIDDSILGRSGMIVRGIATSEWTLRNDSGVQRLLRCSNSRRQIRQDGYSPGAQVLSTFDFYHFGSNWDAAKNLVESCAVVNSKNRN